MRKILFIVIFISQTIYCLSQSEPYIVQHGNTYIRKGIKAHDKDIGNYQSVKIVTKDTTYYQYPHEVSEYRNNVGAFYKTFKIESESKEIDYFLKYHSTTNYGELYSCIDPLGIERIFLLQDELIDLKEYEGSNAYFHDVLRGMETTCDNADDIISDTRFSTASIHRALIALKTCKVRFTPKKSFHLNLAYAGLDLDPNLNASLIPVAQFLSDELYSGSRSILIELAYSVPIDKSIFAFYPSVSFNNYSTRLDDATEFVVFDFDYDVSTIGIAPGFKISVPVNKVKPTLYAGPTFAYPILKDVELRRATTDPETLLVENLVQSADRINFQLGYFVRIGLEAQLTNRLGIGANFTIKEFRQLGGTNPKFDVFIPHFSVQLIWN